MHTQFTSKLKLKPLINLKLFYHNTKIKKIKINKYISSYEGCTVIKKQIKMAYALDIEKRRPDNGPGSNGLRGGSRTYSIKVQTPNWVENYGGPSYYKRGFTNIDFETEGQHQQKGATNK